MRKLLLTIIPAIIFAVCGIAKAETAVDVATNQGQTANVASEIITKVANKVFQSQFGGEQNLIMNYPEKQEVTYKSYIQLPYVGTELPIPPEPIYVDYKWQTWLEKTVFKNAELYSVEEIEKFLSENKDIIQFTGKLIGEKTADEVRLLADMPKNGRKIFSIELEGPENGALDELILRAISIAHNMYKANILHVRARLKLNPKNAGNAVGARVGASLIEGETALAFAAGPQFGKSESRIYDIYQVKVDAYMD